MSYLSPAAPRLDGTPVMTSTLLPEGAVVVGMDPALGAIPVIVVGARPDDHPWCIARKIVREGMRDVLTWLDHPPTYLTGREVLDQLAGRPVWTPHRRGRAR